MAFDGTSLKDFLNSHLETNQSNDILIKEILDAVSLPIDKFQDSFVNDKDNKDLQLSISCLRKYIHIQSDTFATFKSINFLLFVTQHIGGILNDDFDSLITDWKTKVENMGLNEISNLSSKLQDYKLEVYYPMVQLLLDKVQFPKEIGSWGIGLGFLKIRKSQSADKVALENITKFLLEKEWKDLNCKEMEHCLEIILYSLQEDTDKGNFEIFLNKVVEGENNANGAVKRNMTLLISKALDLKLYSNSSPIPVNYVKYMSAQDPPTFVLQQQNILEYSWNILQNCKDPMYVSTISGLFLNYPDEPLDQEASDAIFSIFAKHELSDENSIYTNLLTLIQVKGRDGLFKITTKALESIVTPLSADASNTTPSKRSLPPEIFKNYLKLLQHCGQSPKNFIFDLSIVCNSVGELCLSFILSSSNGGKNIPTEIELFQEFLILFDKYIQMGYPLSKENYSIIYNILFLEAVSKERNMVVELISFLSNTLGKLKYPIDTVCWDLAIFNKDLDPKGIFLASIMQNSNADIFAAILLLLTTEDVKKLEENYKWFGVCFSLSLLESKRTVLKNTIQKIGVSETTTLTGERKSVILNLIVEKNLIPFMDIWWIYFKKTEFNAQDLQVISAYLRNSSNYVLLAQVRQAFLHIKEKGDCYENGYDYLYDIHDNLLTRFPTDLSRGFEAKQSIFNETALKKFMESLPELNDVLKKQILESVSLPIDKFTDSFGKENEKDNLKLSISSLQKFIQSQNDLFAIFQATNRLFLIANQIGISLKDSIGMTDSILSDWQKKVDGMSPEDISDIIAKAHYLRDEMSQPVGDVLIKKLKFPDEIKSWGIALQIFGLEPSLSPNEEEEDWKIWPIMWGEYVLFALQYQPQNENRIKMGVQLLSRIPPKPDKPNELNINNWEEIKVLLDKLLQEGSTSAEVKNNIKKVYASLA